MKKNFFIFLITLIILTACSNPWQGEDGIISIRIGGGSSSNKATWNGIETDDLLHTITVSGPGRTQTKTFEGTETITFSVQPGEWNISVVSSMDGVNYAQGNTRETIVSGMNGSVIIKMLPYIYKIGETGPGGGIIFYYNPQGFNFYTSANDTTGKICHYLEAAPHDIPQQIAWASSAFTNTPINGTEYAIGTGKRNTDLILAMDANAPIVKACNDYSNNGKNDWFLPSIDELVELYNQRAYITVNSNRSLSSSTQATQANCMNMSFSTGSPYTSPKNYITQARAVRAF